MIRGNLDLQVDTRIVMQRGKTLWEHGEEAALCRPGREASEEVTPADTLTLDFQPPALCREHVCHVSPPVLRNLLQRPMWTNTATIEEQVPLLTRRSKILGVTEHLFFNLESDLPRGPFGVHHSLIQIKLPPGILWRGQRLLEELAWLRILSTQTGICFPVCPHGAPVGLYYYSVKILK